jgi:hypothetical protein
MGWMSMNAVHPSPQHTTLAGDLPAMIPQKTHPMPPPWCHNGTHRARRRRDPKPILKPETGTLRPSFAWSFCRCMLLFDPSKAFEVFRTSGG